MVPLEKLEEYLLAPDHPAGAEKARVFADLGYHRTDARQLRAAFLRIVRVHDVQRVLSTPHGTKYVLEGYLEGRAGHRRWIRSVWIEEPGMPGPRLITAYPAKRGK